MLEEEGMLDEGGMLEEGGMLSQADLDALIAAAGQSSEDAELGSGYAELEEEAVPAQASGPSGGSGLVDLPSFAPATPAPVPQSGEPGLGRVRDIPLEVTVELGRTRLLIRDIMDLSAGSIIELDKIAGEPVDLTTTLACG